MVPLTGILSFRYFSVYFLLVCCLGRFFVNMTNCGSVCVNTYLSLHVHVWLYIGKLLPVRVNIYACAHTHTHTHTGLTKSRVTVIICHCSQFRVPVNTKLIDKMYNVFKT